MIEIKEEDIVVNRYVSLTDEDKGDLIQIHLNFYGNHKEAEQLKQQILQNQKLRELMEKKIDEMKNAKSYDVPINDGGMDITDISLIKFNDESIPFVSLDYLKSLLKEAGINDS